MKSKQLEITVQVYLIQDNGKDLRKCPWHEIVGQSTDNAIRPQSIQSLVVKSYRHGLGLLWASLNQTKQEKKILKIKDFMKDFS